MIFCDKPWTFMYFINAEEGQVWPCSWVDDRMNMGNILEEDVEQLIHGENIEKLRKSILEGTFRYCDRQKCTDLANGWLPDLTEDEIKRITETKQPYEFNLAYEETCNHACPSCRNGYFKGDEEYYKKVDIIGEKLLPYLNKAKSVNVNGKGEIFQSKHMLATLKKLKPEDENFVLSIETNAALFDEQHWKEIEHLGKYTVNVMATVNSFHDSTYRFLNGYANHVDQVLENLKFIRSLRRKGIVNRFSISMIVQEPNFRELPEYVERCLNEFEADFVRIRAIMQFSMDENDFWFKDVFNPAHPYYREAIDILHHPVMQDERVWFWEGDYEHSRRPREMPKKRFEQYYNILVKMTEMEDENKLEHILDCYSEKRVALYGGGKIAEYLIRKLPKGSFCCVLDANKTQGFIGDVPICNLSVDSAVPELDVIINTVAFYQDDMEGLLAAIKYDGEIIQLEKLLEQI